MAKAEGKRRPSSLYELLRLHAPRSGKLGSMARAAQRAIAGDGSDDDEWNMILMLRYHAARMGTARTGDGHEAHVLSCDHEMRVEAEVGRTDAVMRWEVEKDVTLYAGSTVKRQCEITKQVTVY